MKKDYVSALEFLNQFYERTINRKNKHHLELMSELLEQCSITLDDFDFVQIAGSCGKGSTAHFISSILRENNIKHGLFTGPHLEHYEERFQVNGQQISASEFAQIVMDIAEKLSDYPRFHEVGHMHIMILIALSYFKNHQIQLVIFENGVGGKSDPSNIFQPMIAVLTEITLDHCHLLGHSIEAITKDKLQIIKEGTSSVVCGMQNTEAREVLFNKEKNTAAFFFFYERDYGAQKITAGLQHNRFDYKGVKQTIRDIVLPLAGDHQIQNAANALATIECLAKKGVPFSAEKIRKGLERVFIPCRMEHVHHNGISFLFDGAHNSLELKTLKKNLQRLQVKVSNMIMTVSSNKDIQDMVQAIYLEGAEIYLVPNPFMERRVSFAEITSYLDTLNAVSYRTFPTIEAALNTLYEEAGKEEHVTLVTGSLYLVGRIKNIINQGEYPFA